jgi:hypothetical protein
MCYAWSSNNIFLIFLIFLIKILFVIKVIGGAIDLSNNIYKLITIIVKFNHNQVQQQI